MRVYSYYEKDLNFDERKQGYGLTMQQGSQALMALGLYDEKEEELETFQTSFSTWAKWWCYRWMGYEGLG